MNLLTEEDIKKWALSLEDLINDETGLQEFMNYLEKEYSLENIKFWLAVNNFKKCTESEIVRYSTDIYNEFLAPGAFYEINIDGKTKENVLKNMENPSIIMFDDAAEHVYMLLLKKDSYPRFIRSEHYKYLLTNGVQHLTKKRGLCGSSSKYFCEDQIKGIACSCAQYGSKSVLYSNQLTPGSSATKRTISSRTSSPLDFFLNIGTVSPSRSESNISERGYLSGAEDRISTGGITPLAVERPMVDDVCPWDAPEYKHIKMPTRDLLLAYNSAGPESRGRSRSMVERFSWICCMGSRDRRRSGRRSPAKSNQKERPVSIADAIGKTPSPSTSDCHVPKLSSARETKTNKLKTSPSVKCDQLLLTNTCVSNPPSPKSDKSNHPKASSSKAYCEPSSSTNFYVPKSPSNTAFYKPMAFFSCNPMLSKKCSPKRSAASPEEKCSPKLFPSFSQSKQLLSSDIKTLKPMKLFASAKKQKQHVTPSINISSVDSKNSVAEGAAAAMAVIVSGIGGKTSDGVSKVEKGEGSKSLGSKAWFGSETVKFVRKNISHELVLLLADDTKRISTVFIRSS